MSKTIKAAFFMPYNKSMTGGPRVLLNFMDRVDEKKISPIAILPSNNPLVIELNKRGIQTYVRFLPQLIAAQDGETLSYGFFKKVLSLLALLSYNRKVYGVLKSERVEIIWVRNIKGVLLCGFAARLLRIPLIWDIGLEAESKGFIRLLHKIGLRLANKVITEGKSQQKGIFGDYLYKKFSSKIDTINPGIPEKTIKRLSEITPHGESNEKFKILTVASISPRKNQYLLVETVGDLVSEFPSIQLDIVGPVHDQEYYSTILRFIDDNELKENVLIHGWSDDIPKFMEKASIFALCSTNEGIPYVIHEAMHASIPSIVTNVGGMPDAVVHNGTGFIIEKNDKDSLIKWIKEFIHNPSKRIEFGLAARLRANQEFSPEKWYQEYEQLFISLAKRN